MKHMDILLPKSPHIIKALYDNDVVEEEVLLAWGEKVLSLQILLQPSCIARNDWF